MSNDCIPLFEDADRVTGKATAAITGKTFVKISGNKDATTSLYSFAPAGAGDVPFGVAAFDAAQDALVTVIAVTSGIIVPVTASGALVAGGSVKVAAGGKATASAVGDAGAFGTVMTGAADGTDAEIALGHSVVPIA